MIIIFIIYWDYSTIIFDVFAAQSHHHVVLFSQTVFLFIRLDIYLQISHPCLTTLAEYEESADFSPEQLFRNRMIYLTQKFVRSEEGVRREDLELAVSAEYLASTLKEAEQGWEYSLDVLEKYYP